MRRLVLIAIAMMAVAQLPEAGSAQANSIYDDYPVQCGATYFLLWHGYKLKNNPNLADEYRRKYEILIERAELNLRARGLNKEKSDEYIQDHVDFFVKIADENTELFVGFKLSCDEKFSERR